MFWAMTKLEKIEKSVEALSDEDLQSFAKWFDALRWQRWDRQIERDVASGRLDYLANEASEEMAAGRIKPL